MGIVLHFGAPQRNGRRIVSKIISKGRLRRIGTLGRGKFRAMPGRKVDVLTRRAAEDFREFVPKKFGGLAA